MVYILRFSQPIGTTRHSAQYYIGYCDDSRLTDRLAEHRSGCAAAITRHASKNGIAFELVATLPGGRDVERRLKRRKNHRLVVDRLLRGTLRL